MSDTTLPVCPKCGGNDIKQWDLVPVPYRVLCIDAERNFAAVTDDDAGESPCWDAASHDEFTCCACGYSNITILPFIPEPLDGRGDA